MNLQNDKEGSVYMESSVIVKLFTPLAACVGGFFFSSTQRLIMVITVFGARNPSSQPIAKVSQYNSRLAFSPAIQPTTAQVSMPSSNISVQSATPFR